MALEMPPVRMLCRIPTDREIDIPGAVVFEHFVSNREGGGVRLYSYGCCWRIGVTEAWYHEV
jgi:hypothetical protein